MVEMSAFEREDFLHEKDSLVRLVRFVKRRGSFVGLLKFLFRLDDVVEAE